MEGDRVLWEYEDWTGAKGFFVLTDDHPLMPKYELAVDSADGGMANELVIRLERSHLAGLWLAILEQADSLEWAGKALNREAAIRSVMKIREVGREQAAAIVDGK